MVRIKVPKTPSVIYFLSPKTQVIFAIVSNVKEKKDTLALYERSTPVRNYSG